jgi:tryptophanyl-tRNA synthetase
VLFDPEAKPGISNLLTIYSALSGRPVHDLTASYDGRGYGDLKKDLADVVVDFVTPFRDRTLQLLEDRTELDRVLADGAARARAVAGRTLADVYDRVGFIRPGR